jgi:DNA primase large subunit
MIRSDYNRVEAKKRALPDHKRRQFAEPQFKKHDYQHRLNFYVLPPTAQITLEEFEEWAIMRLKGNHYLIHLSRFRLLTM